MDTSPHGGNHGENIVQGDGGYKIEVKKESDDYLLTLSGPGDIHGLLVYVEKKDGTRFGEFGLDNNLLQYKSCDGVESEKSTITHNSKDPKNLPLKLKWKPTDSNFGEATVRSVVVVNFTNWYHLADVKFKSS